MRTQSRIMSSIAAWLVGLGVAGCTDEPVPAPEESTSTVSEELISPVTFTIYYAEPAHIRVVGRCTHTICPDWPKGTFCTGHKSDYFIVYEDTCD
jgi:hypothetical protein